MWQSRFGFQLHLPTHHVCVCVDVYDVCAQECDASLGRSKNTHVRPPPVSRRRRRRRPPVLPSYTYIYFMHASVYFSNAASTLLNVYTMIYHMVSRTRIFIQIK